MAAAAALNVVKQIEALADAAPTSQMRTCLGQLIASLQCFLDHPDSRVRIGSARTLSKLSRGYGEDFRKNDLTKIESALARCQPADGGEDSPDGDEEAAELRRLLTECLAKDKATNGKGEVEAAVAPAAPAPAAPASSSGDRRGQVVLRLPDDSDGKANATILAKVVTIQGVVSVTLEGPHVIISTRTVDLAADPAFVEDLVSTLSSQEGCEGLTAAKRHGAGPAGTSPARSSHERSAPEAEEEEPEPVIMLDDDEEVRYLDDDDEEEGGAVASPAGGSGSQNGPQWSFFAQTNWMTGRRVLEFDDDPTIAARLAKIKRQAEEKRKEEESRIGAVSRWLGWGKR